MRHIARLIFCALEALLAPAYLNGLMQVFELIFIGAQDERNSY